MANKTGRKWVVAVGYRKVSTVPNLKRLEAMGVIITQQTEQGTTRITLSHDGILAEVERCRAMGMHGLADQLEEVFLS